MAGTERRKPQWKTTASRRLVEDIELEYAVHPRKPGVGAGDIMRTQHFLHQPHLRPAV